MHVCLWMGSLTLWPSLPSAFVLHRLLSNSHGAFSLYSQCLCIFYVTNILVCTVDLMQEMILHYILHILLSTTVPYLQWSFSSGKAQSFISTMSNKNYCCNMARRVNLLAQIGTGFLSKCCCILLTASKLPAISLLLWHKSMFTDFMVGFSHMASACLLFSIQRSAGIVRSLRQ